VVGLSGLITASYGAMQETVKALRAAPDSPSRSFPIVIGGSLIDHQVCRYVGADFWAPDAMSGVRLCQKLMTSPSSPL
jgi:methanogenic corrinoid protein MtbC1